MLLVTGYLGGIEWPPVHHRIDIGEARPMPSAAWLRDAQGAQLCEDALIAAYSEPPLDPDGPTGTSRRREYGGSLKKAVRSWFEQQWKNAAAYGAQS